MGQRSQIYIRYNKGKNMFATYFQWNYGRFMINRGYQLLDFLKKNTADTYSPFLSEKFDFVNFSYKKREDLKVLKGLTQLNLSVGSFVDTCNIMEENFTWGFDNKKFAKYVKINPFKQDNNDGILVIDIQERKATKEEEKENFSKIIPVIKYAFISGTDIWHNTIELINAEKYYAKDYESTDKEGDYKLKDETYNQVKEQIKFIDENFQMLTEEEFDKIFESKYNVLTNLELADLTDEKAIEKFKELQNKVKEVKK